jgi:Tfp pilus assembly protein PilW
LQVKAVNSLATPPDLGWTASTNAGIPASFPANPEAALVAGARTPTLKRVTDLGAAIQSVLIPTSIVFQRKLTTALQDSGDGSNDPSAAIGSYTSNDLTEGTSYTFTVLAQNILGSSSQPATLVAQPDP